MTNTILEMRNITKTFPGVKALSDVNLDVREAEIQAIVGENGAGKSTLMKVLSGVYPVGSYDGQIIYKGEEQSFKSIRDSEHKGIVIIHQELALVPLLSIAENIFLGKEPSKLGVINWSELYQRTSKLLQDLNLDIDPRIAVGNLGIGQQQLVEIAKALSKEAKILVLVLERE
jgi:putative multiple sugar transport system ATP-binding protein